jgi:hypothetical protein
MAMFGRLVSLTTDEKPVVLEVPLVGVLSSERSVG